MRGWIDGWVGCLDIGVPAGLDWTGRRFSHFFHFFVFWGSCCRDRGKASFSARACACVTYWLGLRFFGFFIDEERKKAVKEGVNEHRVYYSVTLVEGCYLFSLLHRICLISFFYIDFFSRFWTSNYGCGVRICLGLKAAGIAGEGLQYQDRHAGLRGLRGFYFKILFRTDCGIAFSFCFIRHTRLGRALAHGPKARVLVIFSWGALSRFWKRGYNVGYRRAAFQRFNLGSAIRSLRPVLVHQFPHI